MKTRTLRAERKFFPTFDLRLTSKTAVKFAAEALCIFLVASVPEFGFSLALALFCGLAYARQNILAIAPAFILASCVFMLSWWTLLYAAVPVLLLFSLYAVFFKLKRNVPLWAVALTALAGMIPYAVCSCVFDGAYFAVAVSAALALVMTFACGVVAYAVFVRGYAHKSTVDELICAGLLITVAGYALGGVSAYQFGFYYTVLGFLALFSSICFKTQITLFITILLGTGGALQSGDLSVLAASAAVGAVSVALSPFTKWASALAIVATTAAMWLFGAYGDAGWQTLIMTAVGAAVCLLIPKAVLARIKGFGAGDNRNVYTGVVNRRGRELASKLYSASDVFFAMSQNLENTVKAAEIFNPDRLAHDIAQNYCGKCPDREECFSALGEDTYTVIKPMADSAMNRGRVTILDMPPFITSRCTRTHSLASVINSTADSYKHRQEINDGAMLGKKMMSEQFAGIAVALDLLASKSSEQIRFACDETDFLKSELLKHNIVASELVVCGGGSNVSAVALVREQDSQKLVLARLLSRALKTRLEISRIEDRGEQKLVYLESAPVFEVAYGIAECKRDGESVSGDSRSILCPSRSRRLFAICDGMGSGESASKASMDAVNMIEGFYRAGFDDNIILSLVNKLLKLSLDDSFTTLDISVIDTSNGGLDIIKLGSASSFIVRKDNVETLSCTQPPAGILDGVQPLTCRYQLFDGDMLIMMSDGVFDALESRGVIETVDELSTLNPQILADELLQRAKKMGAQDDCTVLVMRMFAV